VWHIGRVSYCKLEDVGLLPGSAAFETIQLCQKSSTFGKVIQKVQYLLHNCLFSTPFNFGPAPLVQGVGTFQLTLFTVYC
jgi:hypothetical protein